MPKAIKRFSVRKKEGKRFLYKISQILGIDAEKVFGSKPQIEIINVKRKRIYLIDGVPQVAMLEDIIFPTLFFKEYLNQLPKVTVDMGAVPYICNGADIMAPGIVEVSGDFKEKALVAVIDERNKRLIAVAQALFDSEKTRTIRKGKALRNLHYVGDEIWNLMKDSFSAYL
ncbi:DUF1947 domain-containing protein [Candidatus Bathyarchaeota archaeon]|nr:MAG: DUF1947 domain-containing protein [Candidatus Bathyarchaeota archaeon]